MYALLCTYCKTAGRPVSYMTLRGSAAWRKAISKWKKWQHEDNQKHMDFQKGRAKTFICRCFFKHLQHIILGPYTINYMSCNLKAVEKPLFHTYCSGKSRCSLCPQEPSSRPALQEALSNTQLWYLPSGVSLLWQEEKSNQKQTSHWFWDDLLLRSIAISTKRNVYNQSA